MDIFSRFNPAYKNVSKVTTVAQAQPAASSWLSGLLGPLFGSSMPAYKTVDGHGAQAPSSSGFWSMFGSAPSYKTVSASSAAPLEVDACDACDLGVDENAACDIGPDQIVVL